MGKTTKWLRVIIAVILLVEGAVIVAFPPAMANNNPIVRFIAFFMAIMGFCYLLLILFSGRPRKKRPTPGKAKHRANLATRLITKLTLNNRLKPYLPAFGVAVIAIDIIYNAVYNTWSIGPTDTTSMLFGGMLVVYNRIPRDFAWERDFIMLFSLVLVVILIVPLMITRALQGDPDASVNMYSRVVLGPPLIVVLNLIGIQSRETGVSLDGYPLIEYRDINGELHQVGISAACAGLYSFSIFVGLFTAYVLVTYSRFNLKIGLLLVIGFLTSYFANILRMAIIVMAGFYYGFNPVLWLTHEWAGLLIFAFWLAIFWLFLVKYMRSEMRSENAPPSAEQGATGKPNEKAKKDEKKDEGKNEENLDDGDADEDAREPNPDETS